jgi:hypothetical protein
VQASIVKIPRCSPHGSIHSGTSGDKVFRVAYFLNLRNGAAIN